MQHSWESGMCLWCASPDVEWQQSPNVCDQCQTGYYWKVIVLADPSRPTLCDSMDCSPLGSSAHGILQARIVEWVAISYSRGSFRPSDWTHIYRIAVRFLTTAPPGLKMLCSTWSHILQQNSLSLFLWRRQGSFNNNNNNYKCVKSLGPWLKMGPPLPTFCWTN